MADSPEEEEVVAEDAEVSMDPDLDKGFDPDELGHECADEDGTAPAVEENDTVGLEPDDADESGADE